MNRPRSRTVAKPVDPQGTRRRQRANLVRLLMLGLWAVAGFGVAFFARGLDFELWGWPFNFWFAAQGAVLVFLLIVVVYAIYMNRQPETAPQSPQRPSDVS